MTRNGKIARLPRNIRDELNRRLDDGEQGVQLLEWLNGLPEVKQILDSEFDGRPINEVNFTRWKNGGFLEWQTQKEALALLQGFKSDGDDLTKVSAAELLDPLAAVLMAHYTAACYRSNTDETEDPRASVRRLGKSLRDVIRLRRSELAREQVRIGRERVAIDREWIALEKSKIENRNNSSSAKSKRDENSDAPDLDSMTREERSAYIKKIIYGD